MVCLVPGTIATDAFDFAFDFVVSFVAESDRSVIASVSILHGVRRERKKERGKE